MFPVGRSGRESNFKTNSARLGLTFPSDEKIQQFGCDVTAIDHDTLSLDEFILYEINLMNSEDSRDYIQTGESFRIFEGARLIGGGTWADAGKNRQV